MKRVFYYTIALSFALSSRAVAQETSIFPKGEKAANVHHVGNVWLNELSEPDTNFNYNITVATFDPGARLDWHIHPDGQILLIIDGTGYYQEKGKPKKTVRKGDTIKCPPGLEHWHGATPETGFTYLATTPTQKGKTIWLQKVTNDQYFGEKSRTGNIINTEQEIINLSKMKWRWLSERKVDSLASLFNDQAVFVHMGATFSKTQELDVVRRGDIQYKQADIQETSVRFIGNTAILLSKIRLVAIVGGNEVINPFMVTEVYVQQDSKWTLGSMSFTRLITPDAVNK